MYKTQLVLVANANVSAEHNQIKYSVMKTIKKTKKTDKKFNPAFVVDLTEIEGPEDVTIEFIAAKVRAGISIRYKRFWNWITRKK